MDNYDTKYLNNKQSECVVPYDTNISYVLPKLFDKYEKNDISSFNNQMDNKREIKNKFLNSDKTLLYTIIYKTYQKGKLIDIFFLLKNKNNLYCFIDNINEIYKIDNQINNDLLKYKKIHYNNLIIKILIINNLEYNLENNGFGWASIYEICNLNKLNDIDIEETFINFINNNIQFIK